MGRAIASDNSYISCRLAIPFPQPERTTTRAEKFSRANTLASIFLFTSIVNFPALFQPADLYPCPSQIVQRINLKAPW